MVENKYFYYLLALNALINIINFVPRILIVNRFHGAIMSILISVVVGSCVLYGVTKLYSRFPGEGLPEILQTIRFPLVAKSILFTFGCFWFSAGAITLVSFVDITNRYIIPDLSPTWILSGFLIIVCLSSRLNTNSILYGLEMLVLLNIPVILYFLVKTLISRSFSWDAVMQVGTYLFEKPNLESVAAATFIFSGYTNLSIFNRVFGKIRLRHFWIVAVFGLSVLLTTFFIPIGYHGTQGVENHFYPWFSTADSIRIELFIIERSLYFFYFIYITLALVSSITHWHVSLQLFQGMLYQKKRRTGVYVSWFIIAAFTCASYSLLSLDQEQLQVVGIGFLESRFVVELMFPALLLYVLHRRSSYGK